MPGASTFAGYLMAKLNTRSASMLCAFVLICGGIYMCFAGLSAKGSIDIKAALLQGRIETGSLGLLTMFLGVFIVLALNLNRPYAGQVVKVVVNGKQIIGRGLSYRKISKLVELASSTAVKQAPSELNSEMKTTSSIAG